MRETQVEGEKRSVQSKCLCAYERELTDDYGVQRLRDLVRSEALFDDLVPFPVVGHQPARAREEDRAEGIRSNARAAADDPTASLQCCPSAVEKRQKNKSESNQPQHGGASQKLEEVGRKVRHVNSS